MTDKNCASCKGYGWVCENHRDIPFEACTCGGAGNNCKCNKCGEMPEDTIITASVDKSEVTKIH